MSSVMDPIQRLLSETRRYTIEISGSYWVCITHINNPHSFYVRPYEYNRYMPCLQTPGYPVTTSDIKMGAVVIYKSRATKEFLRGKIVYIEGRGDQLRCDLFAIDVGCVENCVPIQQLWKLYHRQIVPPLACHCQLSNCVAKADNWSEPTIQAMRGYVKGQIVRIEIQNILPEVLIVQVSVHSPDDLSTLLAITRHSYMASTDAIDYQIIVSCSPVNHNYAERIIPAKSVLYMRMLSGSFLDKFFAAQVDEYNTYLVESQNYSAYAFTQRSLYIGQLVLNAPVGVFCDSTKKFERGIVREINTQKNKAKVELVDWGKIVEETPMWMRPIPRDFLTTPPMAIYCGLHISQYATTKLSEIEKLATCSHTGVEFFGKFEEVSETYDNPNLVSIFGVKT